MHVPLSGGVAVVIASDTSYRLAVENEKLTIPQKGRPPRALTPTTRDGFIAPDGFTFEFQREAQGRIRGFVMQAGRVRGLVFLRRP